MEGGRAVPGRHRRGAGPQLLRLGQAVVGVLGDRAARALVALRPDRERHARQPPDRRPTSRRAEGPGRRPGHRGRPPARPPAAGAVR